MTTIYKSSRHAAKAFARRYLNSLGGGWFQLGNRKLRGLYEVYSLMKKRGYALEWSCGRIEMVFDILDHCIIARNKKKEKNEWEVTEWER